MATGGYAPQLLDEIRSRVDLVDLVGRFVNLKQSGENWKGLCPFHAEKTPSFMVNSKRGIFHCFGCGVGGDAFGFLMRQDRLSFPEAVRTLAKTAGVDLPPHSINSNPTMEAPRGNQEEAPAVPVSGWTEWLGLDTLKILCRHGSGVIGAIIVFRVITLVAEWGLPRGNLRTVLEAIDSFVLAGLTVWLASQMAVLLWKRRVK